MNHNPYAPPAAEVADVVVQPPGTEEPPLFAVSPLKLYVMSVCTLQIYEIFWFARQWKAIAAREGRVLHPYLRAFLAVLYCYPCFARIRRYGTELPGATLPAGLLATAFVAGTLLSMLPDPYWMISVWLQPLVLVAVQRYVQRLNSAAAPSHDRNARFSAWNWIAIVAGGLLLTAAGAAMVLGLDGEQ